MCKHYAPPLISLCILIFTVCIALLAGSINTKEEMAIPAIADNFELTEDEKLNEAEILILNVLDSAGAEVKIKRTAGTEEYNTYKNQLKSYFERDNVNVKDSITQDIVNKIIQLNAIMDMENEFDINKMSLDGRELAIRLSQEIYDMCGLKLSYNMQGEIIRITDKTGKDTFFKNSAYGKAEFQGEVLAVTVAAILFLILLCISIAKKNQLFVKDVKYDGFNEKGYA